MVADSEGPQAYGKSHGLVRLALSGQPVDGMYLIDQVADKLTFLCKFAALMKMTVIVISKLLKRHSKSKRRAPAYSRALRKICIRSSSNPVQSFDCVLLC